MKPTALPVRRFAVSLAACLALFLTGCFGPGKDFNGVSSKVVDSLDAAVEAGPRVKLGPVTLFLAGTVIGLVPDADEELETAKAILRNLRRVEVGVYELRDAASSGIPADLLADLDDMMEKQGLEPVVRHVSGTELASVYVQVKSRRVKQLYVIALNRTDLNIVRLKGRLDKVVALALKESDLEFGDLM